MSPRPGAELRRRALAASVSAVTLFAAILTLCTSPQSEQSSQQPAPQAAATEGPLPAGPAASASKTADSGTSRQDGAGLAERVARGEPPATGPWWGGPSQLTVLHPPRDQHAPGGPVAAVLDIHQWLRAPLPGLAPTSGEHLGVVPEVRAALPEVRGPPTAV